MKKNNVIADYELLDDDYFAINPIRTVEKIKINFTIEKFVDKPVLDPISEWMNIIRQSEEQSNKDNE